MPCRAVFTSRADGDLSTVLPEAELDERRRRLVERPWSWLRQVHGSTVVRVDEPGACAGAEADAAITAVPGVVLAIHTADCVPLALFGDRALGVAHVGWRGLQAGVVEATVRALRVLEAHPVRAEIGPSIRPPCYEFGAADLDAVAERYGPAVRAVTADGRPALDLAAGVSAALARVGVPAPDDGGVCTACSPAHWSFRARSDAARQALVAWLEP